MRISPVLPAIVVIAITAVAGCIVSREGIPGSGAGGSQGTTTGAGTTTSSTSTGEGACSTKSDCPADNLCTTSECTQGQCVLTKPNEGMTIADPDGNCRKIVCLSGVPTAQDDDEDFAEDGDPCTIDGCKNGNATHVPGHESMDCGSPGQHCYGGKCLDCAIAANCSVKECNSSVQCIDEKCAQQPGMDGTVCTGGTCLGGSCCVGTNKVCGSTCCGGIDACSGGTCCPTGITGCNGICCAVFEHCTASGCKL